MTLWDMLDKTKYYQNVWIFETNAYDQNMPIFKGTVDEARRDADRDQSCPLWGWCCRNSEKTDWNSPDRWHDPEEGGGEDG